jgi:hypothetical protein
MTKELPMSRDEAFVKQFPFPLIETNIPGAYALPAWPDDLDFHKASPATLLKHGVLWRRPEAGEELAPFWDRMFSRPWKDRIVPHLEPQPGRTHVLNGLRSSDATFTSNNWSGGVLLGSFVSAFGTWLIPTASKPTEPQGNEGGWNSSSWVGIDGFNVTGLISSNDVLQAGIEQKVDAKGNVSYVAWYEWFAPQQANSPPYIFQTNIPGFLVSPGQSINCSIQYLVNQKAGQITLGNGSTGKNFSMILKPPPGANFNGKCVEWIMEAPDGGYPNSALPKFTPVKFNPAFGCDAKGNATTAQGADTVNIVNGTKTLTSVQLAPSLVTIDFLG